MQHLESLGKGSRNRHGPEGPGLQLEHGGSEEVFAEGRKHPFGLKAHVYILVLVIILECGREVVCEVREVRLMWVFVVE